jgi:hypothetical protein
VSPLPPALCIISFLPGGKFRKRQPFGSSTKHRPLRPLSDKASHFSRHYFLDCLALEDKTRLLSLVFVVCNYKHKMPITPKERRS